MLFIYSILAMLGLHCSADFSLVVESGGYSLVEVCGLPLQGLLLLWSTDSGTWAQQLWLLSSGAQA